MNGLNEIKNVNFNRTLAELAAVKEKAATAKEQNHPQAARFQAEAESLEKELAPELQARGFKLNS
jgi:capsule polysaccharide export protein KpsE/RkpR